ncbi:C-X-C motif chemokine 13 [Symphorus nematophorus]
MTRPLLLLAALTLCCCIATMHGCRCIRTTTTPVAIRLIQKIEVIPISGRCRRTEIIITRMNGSKVCVNPKLRWINILLNEVQKRDVTPSPTTDSSTASTINY